MDYWHIENNNLFKEFKKGIDNNYPTLNVSIEGKIVFVRGTLRLKDSSGKEIDSYLIEIRIPHNYPKKPPQVKEIGSKLPKTSDRHVNKDGTACLYFRDEEYKYWNKNSTIVDFIKNVIEKFFLWQTEYNLTNGRNKNESWGHGIAGAIEFYSDILKTKEIKIIYKFVKYLSKKKIKKDWPCFCGSGRGIRDCHYYLIREYHKEKITRKNARETLKGLENLRKNV